MTTINPYAMLSQPSVALTALDVLFAPIPSTVTLDPGKGLFSSQATDFQTSLKTAEKSWQTDSSPAREPGKPSRPPAASNADGPETIPENVPPAEPPPAKVAETSGAAQEKIQPSAVAQAAPGGESGSALTAVKAGVAAVGSTGAVAAGAGSVKGLAVQDLASQPVAENGELALATAATGKAAKPSSQMAAEAALAPPSGQTAKNGPATGSGAGSALAGSDPKGVLADLGGKAFNGQGFSGNTFTGNGAPANNPASLNLAQFAGNSPLASGTGGSEAAAGLLDTAGRVLNAGTGAESTMASPSGGLASNPGSPTVTQPAGGLTLAAAGKIGGIPATSAGVVAKGGSTQPALQADVVRQVVQKAALFVRNGRPEMRIDLKPESLGSIKLHVTTVNHQVQVKIMAQTQVVKEILEGSLNQLKLDLLHHKLDVDRFDVTVAGDADRQFGDARQGAATQRERNETAHDHDQESGEQQEAKEQKPAPGQSWDDTPGQVDYFV